MENVAHNNLTILGSSSGMPQAGRATSGYLLKTGESLTLIDCGGGVTKSFLSCRFDPLAVDRIFISHTHPDHVCELPLFLQMIYLKKRERPLELFLPDEFVKPFATYINALYLMAEKFPFDLQISGYSDGFVYNGPFQLRARGNNHLKSYREIVERMNLPNKLQCHSFEIQAGSKKLLYSADIASLADIAAYLSDKDIVLVEVTHVDLETLLQHAANHPKSRILLMHLGTPEQVEEIERKIKESRAGNVETVYDGMVIEL